MKAELFEGLLSTLRFGPEARSVLLRAALGTLGQTLDEEPTALAHVDGARLSEVADAVLTDSWFDTDAALSPSVAVALYAIAAVLPRGPSRTELGRRVATMLYQGRATTFVAIATHMARTNAGALSGTGMIARTQVAMFLPSTLGVDSDELALAIATRREVAQRFVLEAATRSLPDRRLASRVLLRAARAAARRAEAGDRSSLRLLVGDTDLERARGDVDPGVEHPIAPARGLAETHRALLAEREPAVWQPAAAANGFIARVDDEAAERLRAGLRAKDDAGAWRRAALGLGASLGRGEIALAEIRELLASGLIERDPGVASSLVTGIAAAADAEPDATDEALEDLARVAPLAIAEALVDLRMDAPGAGARAAALCATALSGRVETEVALAALASDLEAELRLERTRPLVTAVREAERAYVQQGALAAASAAASAMDLAGDLVDQLHRASRGARPDPAIAARALRDLEAVVLETRTLPALLLLRHGPEPPLRVHDAVDALEERLASALLSLERATADDPRFLTMHHRQLKALVHLVDADAPDLDADESRRDRLRLRWEHVVTVTTERLRREPHSAVRRAVAATLARALDALVRHRLADPADALLFVTTGIDDSEVLAVLAQASRQPDVVTCLGAYAALERDLDTVEPREALDRFVCGLPVEASEGCERLARALDRLGRELSHFASGHDRTDRALTPALRELEMLRELSRGAAHRMTGRAPRSPSLVDGDVRAQLETVLRELPPGVAQAAERAIRETTERVATTASTARMLPSWLPARGTLGGYTVHDRIGQGASASVLLVSRTDAEGSNPERYALKVPHYDEVAARSLSEAEFLRLFRQEASALLDLPEHPNLARFISFDTGARPKPILVMELVVGAPVEDILARAELSTKTALDVLEGVLTGLAVMHAAGIAHLDLKPSNVIMRQDGTPVIVDFGLAGRRLRPGCGTACYGAPEVWLGHEASPVTAVDMYAFACMGYELLTSITLFDGPSDHAIMSAHLMHDGDPPKLAELAKRPGCAPLANLLSSCLLRDARARPRASAALDSLRSMRTSIESLPWPLRV